jgi:hypothetical protein
VWLGVNVGALDETGILEFAEVVAFNVDVGALYETGILEFVEVVAFNVDVGNDGKAIVVVGATEDVIGVL